MRKGRTQSASNKAITRSQTRHRAVLTQHSQVKIALSRITLTVRCHHPPMKGRARETSRTRRPLTMTKFALWAQQSVALALAGPHIQCSRRTRAHGRRLKRLSPIHHISAPARAQNGVWTQAKSVPSATSSQASWDDASQTTPPEESNWFWRLLRLGLWTRARARLDSAAPPGPVGARRQPLQASTYMLGDEIRSGITARPHASKSAASTVAVQSATKAIGWVQPFVWWSSCAHCKASSPFPDLRHDSFSCVELEQDGSGRSKCTIQIYSGEAWQERDASSWWDTRRWCLRSRGERTDRLSPSWVQDLSVTRREWWLVFHEVVLCANERAEAGPRLGVVVFFTSFPLHVGPVAVFGVHMLTP